VHNLFNFIIFFRHYYLCGPLPPLLGPPLPLFLGPLPLLGPPPLGPPLPLFLGPLPLLGPPPLGPPLPLFLGPGPLLVLGPSYFLALFSLTSCLVNLATDPSILGPP